MRLSRRRLLATPLVTSLALVACGTADKTGPQRFRGVWDFHFETSSFVVEDGAGPYWLSADGDTWAKLTAPFSREGVPWGRAAIEVEGELSALGQYGHMGAYERELRVTRVISARLIERDEVTR